MVAIGRWYVLANRVGRVLGHRITRYVLSWLLAIAVAWQCTENAWNVFKSDKRPDGNSGHTAIDFGGQWIMGRMLVNGEGAFLYERNHIRTQMEEDYPRALEEPNQQTHDVDSVMGSFMGPDNKAAPPIFASCLLPLAADDGLGAALLAAVGMEHCWQPSQMAEAAKLIRGPLYPPINAFVYFPLGLFPPQDAYRIMQGALLGFALLAAWGVRRLSRGRIWVPVAVALIIAYPGFSGAQVLAQNSALTLTLLIWGWVLVVEGRPGWAGVVWGLLAFKPVWALAFFLVPLLTRRWRMCVAMAATALALIVLTLPWVGTEAWHNWWQVGHAGAAEYNVDSNWIFLSRDLLGIPRRFMLDFDKSYPERDLLEAALAGWAMLIFVLEVTATLATLHGRDVRASTGPAPAFLLLGGWLCCYHFMYYDVLLSILPVLLLFTETGPYFKPGFLAWEPLVLWHEPLLMPWQTANLDDQARPCRVSKGMASFLALPAANYGWVRNPFALLVLVVLVLNEQVLEPQSWPWLADLCPWLSIRYPCDTIALIVLWLWCAWLWTRQRFAGQKNEPAYGTLPIRRVDLG